MPEIDPYSPRPEARALPYWKHPKRAQDALRVIIRALETTAGKIKHVEADVRIPGVDPNRASRIFFVSGEPGSGKSTLYLTLRAMLSKGDKEYSEGYPDPAKLDNLQGTVTLLDTLDLEVVGDERENLLAAVLIRLIEVLDTPDAGSNETLSKPCESAIKDLEELTTDIGIAWEGNLQARAGELDPDTFSVEVMRTQRARLRVNERLTKALDDLANNKCCGCDSDTLFVLPVDDFYLKPEASLQLLRLLRMISIPRLFFLVMGDIDTIEALFIEKSLRDWTAVAGASLFPQDSERLEQALTRARELRARYLRKLLPPAQRENIEAMDSHEALNFEVGTSEGVDGERELLEELLSKINLDAPFAQPERKTESLLTFLVSPPLDPLTKEEKQRRENIAKRKIAAEKETKKETDVRNSRTAYTAVQILDATPREIVDFGSELRSVIQKRRDRETANRSAVDKSTPLLLSSIRDVVNLAREEHSFLNEEKQRMLGRVFPTRIYSPEDMVFQMNLLDLEPSSRPRKDIVPKTVWVRSHRSWDLSVHSETLQKTASDDPFASTLPPRPTAWFILLHDLAWRWSRDSLSENLVIRLSKEINSWRGAAHAIPATDGSLEIKEADNVKDGEVKTRESTEKEKSDLGRVPGWAVGLDGDKCRHFPMPDFDDFRDLDRFLYVWSKGIEWFERQEEAQIEDVFSLWKLAGRVILVDSYKDLYGDGDDWYQDSAESGVEWFEQFMKSHGDSFTERFDNFGKSRNKTFDYGGGDNPDVQAWKVRLEAWDNLGLA